MAPFLGREHHDAHDALAIHLQLVARHEHLRLEFRRGLDEQSARARVKPELVADHQFRLGQESLPLCHAPRTQAATTHNTAAPSAHSVAEGRGRCATTNPTPMPASSTSWKISGRGVPPAAIN